MQEACRVNAYIVRAARCTATLDAGYQLAALGLGHDLGVPLSVSSTPVGSACRG
ncbi:hypothetical protein [Streptomyces sp. NPDC005507]|uniref:hypothetical protein n=1 Tax=Streptomyces sp. NPDC005507 TaxID=3154885 RepID=UPI0033A560CE